MKIKNKNSKVLMMSGNKYEKTILKNILSQLIEYELFSCIAYISKISYDSVYDFFSMTIIFV